MSSSSDASTFARWPQSFSASVNTKSGQANDVKEKSVRQLQALKLSNHKRQYSGGYSYRAMTTTPGTTMGRTVFAVGSFVRGMLMTTTGATARSTVRLMSSSRTPVFVVRWRVGMIAGRPHVVGSGMGSTCRAWAERVRVLRRWHVNSHA